MKGAGGVVQKDPVVLFVAVATAMDACSGLASARVLEPLLPPPLPSRTRRRRRARAPSLSPLFPSPSASLSPSLSRAWRNLARTAAVVSRRFSSPLMNRRQRELRQDLLYLVADVRFPGRRHFPGIGVFLRRHRSVAVDDCAVAGHRPSSPRTSTRRG